mmetsp:Transcript_25583/g.37965  ORF Transcript_25583/g.37965 Transcript_25583/m.37965 type:complete len:80 (+) Transcript_25583:88-327(+)
MTTIENEDVLKGSWAPTITVVIILIMRWLITSQGNLAVSLRRMMQMQKLQTKKKLGLRDDSKYKMGAGDGANQKYKRQG